MQEAKQCNRNQNHRTLEDHKYGLIIGDWTLESLTQFRHTENATYKDGGCSDWKGYKIKSEHVRDDREGNPTPDEQAEHLSISQALKAHIERVWTSFAHSPRKMGAEYHKDQQAENLERKTCYHYIDTNIAISVCIRCCGQGSSNGLQD